MGFAPLSLMKIFFEIFVKTLDKQYYVMYSIIRNGV